jgi:hypothetical protein
MRGDTGSLMAASLSNDEINVIPMRVEKADRCWQHMRRAVDEGASADGGYMMRWGEPFEECEDAERWLPCACFTTEFRSLQVESGRLCNTGQQAVNLSSSSVSKLIFVFC